MMTPIPFDSFDRLTKFEIENAEAIQQQSVLRQHCEDARQRMSFLLLGMATAVTEQGGNTEALPPWWKQRRERLAQLVREFEIVIAHKTMHGDN